MGADTADDTTHDVEAQARAMGWKPEEEWQGAPPKGGFLSPEDFLERGEKVLPIIRAANKDLRKQIEGLQQELGTVKQAAQQLNEFNARALEKQRRENQQLLTELEQRRAQAITDGDGQAAVAAERQIAQVHQEQQTLAAQAPPPNTAEVAYLNEWKAANPWYETDEDMQAWADGMANQLIRQGFPQGPTILKEVAKRAAATFPDRLGPRRPGGVEGRGRRSPQNFGQRTFDDLPDEAKAAFDNFKRLGVKITREQYLRDYEWE